MVPVTLLVTPAAFLDTTFPRSLSLCLRFSCRRAGRLSFSRTLARPVLPTLNDFFATVLARAAASLAVSLILPVVWRSALTSIVTMPRLLTLTRRTRGLCGLVPGFGRASAASIAPTASATPPLAVTPAIPATGRAPRLIA